MNILEKLIALPKNEQDLALLIKGNLKELYAFFLSQSFTDLKIHKNKIETYINSNLNLFRKLDFTNEHTPTFILILLDVSERFGFSFPFSRLYKLLQKNNQEISNRLQASSLYLMGVKSINDYDIRIEELLGKLDIAQKEEEDDNLRIISSLIIFYAQVVNNFGIQNLSGVLSIRDRLLTKSKEATYQFLKDPFLVKVLNFEVIGNTTYANIQQELDSFLDRTKKYVPFQTVSFLIEENTPYSLLLKNKTPSFETFRSIAVNQYEQIIDADNVFYSLNRGVSILKEEKQLFTYLRSYGPMHYAKLMSALQVVPKAAFNNSISIFDWGCGQGIGTTILLENLVNENINVQIDSINLIEPSELALKRAALHVKRFNSTVEINTIHKDLDSLNSNELKNRENLTKIHLFSNILDIDSISLPDFLNLLQIKFKGENYFICVSPFINDLKTSRLDSFVEFFSETPNFEVFADINNRKGTWRNGWSRVVRVFKGII